MILTDKALEAFDKWMRENGFSSKDSALSGIIMLFGNNGYAVPCPFTDLPVGMQGETICAWVLLNPNEKENVNRQIEIYGTGHPVHYNMGVERKFIGTAIDNLKGYVWHVFERIN